MVVPKHADSQKPCLVARACVRKQKPGVVPEALCLLEIEPVFDTVDSALSGVELELHS